MTHGHSLVMVSLWYHPFVQRRTSKPDNAFVQTAPTSVPFVKRRSILIVSLQNWSPVRLVRLNWIRASRSNVQIPKVENLELLKSWNRVLEHQADLLFKTWKD